MPDILDFTRDFCYTCDNTWAACSPEDKLLWKPFLVGEGLQRVRVCHECAPKYTLKAQKTRRVSTTGNQAPQETPRVSPLKLVSDAQRGTGRTPVRAISHSAGPHVHKQTHLPTGYTQSHGYFKQAEDLYKKKAGGVTSNSVTVQVKVTMVRPVKKTTKITFTPINEDLWTTISVPADIGMEMLRQMCIEKLGPAWDRWSHHFPLQEKDATLYAIVSGGTKLITSGDKCIFDFFLKKPRGSTATPKYDFFSDLDVSLQISSAFYEEVLVHYETATENDIQPTPVSKKCPAGTASTTHRPKSSGRSKILTNVHERTRETRPSRPRPTRTNSNMQTTPNSAQTDPAALGSVRDLEQPLDNLILSSSRLDPPVSQIVGRKRAVSKSSMDQREDQLPRKSSRTLYVASPADLRTALRIQGAAHDHYHKFKVSFQVIPVREWSREVFVNGLDLFTLHSINGNLEFDVKVDARLKGTFKTAHPGRIHPLADSLPTQFARKVCVKQPYVPRAKNTIGRLSHDEAFRKLSKEIVCLDWAAILLNLTYGFVEQEVEKYGEPDGGIPLLRFARAMLATDAETNQHYLVEEWLEGKFVKYINNGHPGSCLVNASPEAHRIAEFLCFAQHVQYNKTDGEMYTSDYQGTASVLTDPQIISHPKHGRIFGDGNTSQGISRFRANHACIGNRFCAHFQLTFSEVAQSDNSGQD